MANDTRKSITGRAPKADAASSARAEGDSRAGEERAAKRVKTGATERSKSPTQRTGKPPRKPKHQSYHAEIAALADSTVALPSPWRERAIQVVRGIVALFGQAWRGVRRRITPKDADEENDAAHDAGTAGHD